MCAHERLTAYFTGYVQGVGFRFTVLACARPYPQLTGFVRNLPDGRVQLVAEGPREALDAFLQDVRDSMRSYIRDIDIHRTRARGEFTAFTLKH